jgi:hypothetical protein
VFHEAAIPVRPEAANIEREEHDEKIGTAVTKADKRTEKYILSCVFVSAKMTEACTRTLNKMSHGESSMLGQFLEGSLDSF